MGHHLSDWLYEHSTGKIALVSVVLFILFAILVLPGQSAMAEAYGKGLGSPDTTFFYSSQDLHAMAEAYGEIGRQAYIHARFSFDLAFPLVYTFFLAAFISWLLGKALPQANPWRRLNLLPLAAMGFDYLENITTSIFMGCYQSPSRISAFLAPLFTLIKWLLVGGSFFVLLASLVIFLPKKKQ